MSDPVDERNRKYFDFLITDYGFKYHGFVKSLWTIYITETITIGGHVDRYVPSMLIRRPTEPDYIMIRFGDVLEALGTITRDEYEAKSYLDNDMAYLKSMFAKVADVVIQTPEVWWLDAQKLKFMKEEDGYLKRRQDPTWKESHRRWYRYIKTHDPNWESQIPVPEGKGAEV